MDTRQEPLFLERVEDAMDHVIRALGGRKAVAQRLWPSKPPRDAHNLIDACLNPERREKFSPHEFIYLLQKGREIGCHALMHYTADECNYERPKSRSIEQKENDLGEVILNASKILERATRELQAIQRRREES